MDKVCVHELIRLGPQVVAFAPMVSPSTTTTPPPAIPSHGRIIRYHQSLTTWPVVPLLRRLPVRAQVTYPRRRCLHYHRLTNHLCLICPLWAVENFESNQKTLSHTGW